MPKKHHEIVAHYERCLDEHGDSHLGVDWPNVDDVQKRYRVMLDVIRERDTEPVSLLDFGCGAAHLYEYIQEKGISHIHYSGLDMSEKFVELSRQKFPQLQFYKADITEANVELPSFDYMVLNGVFTEKLGLSYLEMFEHFTKTIKCVYEKSNRGLAFNVMSKQVDWERDDLFHVPLDDLADFLTKEVSRHFVIRNDYGLYEYTTYIYHDPMAIGDETNG